MSQLIEIGTLRIRYADGSEDIAAVLPDGRIIPRGNQTYSSERTLRHLNPGVALGWVREIAITPMSERIPLRALFGRTGDDFVLAIVLPDDQVIVDGAHIYPLDKLGTIYPGYTFEWQTLADKTINRVMDLD